VVVEELIHGSESNLPPLPPGARVLEVFLAARGVAYVDLSKEVLDNQPGGSEAEMLSVYSIVNSITTNFPAVRRVQILVDDHPATTFLGHVDLSRPLVADMSLLAPSAVSAVGAPTASPTPLPSPTS
jgi:spore germination protein GerM